MNEQERYLERRKYHREYYRANRDRRKIQRLARREQIRDHNRRYHWRSKYGLTLEQYQELRNEHGNFCDGCGQETVELELDHCHRSNVIRGFLCSKCNLALGLLNDSIETLKRLSNYLAAVMQPEDMVVSKTTS